MLTGFGVTAVLVAAVLSSPVPPDPGPAGDGWGSTTCSEAPSPECELDAGTPGGANPRADVEDRAPQATDPGPGAGREEDDGGAVDDDRVRCSYVRSDFQPPYGGARPASHRPGPGGADGAVRPADGVVTASAAGPVVVRPAAMSGAASAVREVAPPDDEGAWYVWRCTGSGFTDALYRAPVWIADGEVPGVEAGPSPAELAQQARDRLRLPTPSVSTSPVGTQLVNVPTWLWLSGGFEPVSATVAVPGVSVTAVATPAAVVWDMGDGATVTCSGPGTPFVAGGDPSAASPDCGHTYRSSSAGQPGQVFPVTTTVSWTVTWSGAGDGGTFPDLDSTIATTFRVAEVQVLNNGG